MYILIVLFEKRCAHAPTGRSGGFCDTRQPTGVRVRREYSHGRGIFSFRKRVHPFCVAHGSLSFIFFYHSQLLTVSPSSSLFFYFVPAPIFFALSSVDRHQRSSRSLLFPLFQNNCHRYYTVDLPVVSFCLRSCTD